MRDQEKWRDRVELSLDSRQVFLLFAGAAVVLILVFVFGIAVGKRLEGDAVPQAETDPLAILDQLSAGEQDHGAALSFPEALTGGDKGAAAGAAAGGARPSRSPSTPPDEAASPNVAPALPAATAPPAPTLARELARASARAAAEATPNPPTARFAPPLPGARSQSGVSSGLPRPQAAVAVAAIPAAIPAATPTAIPAAPPRGGYTLQVSAFQSEVEAKQFLRQLERRGLHPQLVRAEVPDRGTWYRVRLGQYKSWEQAVAAKEQFERSNGVIAYVTRN
ncbi:MAG: SPOR domain-containing protein [Proteobacteria bacterium]|nr:SPOR domain-containing protein [Pseudomonadota bacterium]